jgi:hypothetical protein
MEETLGGFAKKPFGNTKSVVEYLGRYTHKIAISNHRIRSIDTQNVTLIIRIIGGRSTEANDTHTRRVYQKVFLAYITQTLCKIRHYGFE